MAGKIGKITTPLIHTNAIKLIKKRLHDKFLFTLPHPD